MSDFINASSVTAIKNHFVSLGLAPELATIGSYSMIMESLVEDLQSVRTEGATSQGPSFARLLSLAITDLESATNWFTRLLAEATSKGL